jgi:hypothetical protein
MIRARSEDQKGNNVDPPAHEIASSGRLRCTMQSKFLALEKQRLPNNPDGKNYTRQAALAIFMRLMSQRESG